MSAELERDLFIIPIQNGMNIVYAPLRGAVFYANNRAVQICKSYIKGAKIENNEENLKLLQHLKNIEETPIKEPTLRTINTESNLVIILSQMCNLACTYCYAHESRSEKVLNKEKLKVAIDYILMKESPRKFFSFIGGGEPTLTWDLLKWAISYIRNSVNEQKDINIGITTNGTLLDDEKIKFFSRNRVHLGLSFEILPDVQNMQRSFAANSQYLISFDIIDQAIKKLIDKNVNIGIRSTITKLNVKRMPEMVEFVKKHYPSIKKLHFEQVTSLNNDKVFYDDFISFFMKARKVGIKNDIEIYCSGSHSFEMLKSSFCRGEFCLTPTGEIVSCHRISSKEDSAFDLFNYAKIDENILLIDEDKKKRVEEFHNAKLKQCLSCFAKWHCAGTCAMERAIYSKEMSDLKCYFTKKLLIQLLIECLDANSICNKMGGDVYK